MRHRGRAASVASFLKYQNMSRQATRDYNLSVASPALARQWHPTKNGKLKPENFTAGSIFKAWWQCQQNKKHAWQATINNRTNGRGCPHCHPQNVRDRNIQITQSVKTRRKAEITAFIHKHGRIPSKAPSVNLDEKSLGMALYNNFDEQERSEFFKLAGQKKQTRSEIGQTEIELWEWTREHKRKPLADSKDIVEKKLGKFLYRKKLLEMRERYFADFPEYAPLFTPEGKRKRSPETIAKVAAGNRGKKLTEECKQRLRDHNLKIKTWDDFGDFLEPYGLFLVKFPKIWRGEETKELLTIQCNLGHIFDIKAPWLLHRMIDGCPVCYPPNEGGPKGMKERYLHRSLKNFSPDPKIIYRDLPKQR